MTRLEQRSLTPTGRIDLISKRLVFRRGSVPKPVETGHARGPRRLVVRVLGDLDLLVCGHVIDARGSKSTHRLCPHCPRSR